MTQLVRDRVESASPTTDLATLLTRALGGGVAAARDTAVPVSSICLDSRHVKPGALFVAIGGSKLDGNRFIEDAFAKGAAAAVTDSELPQPAGRRVIRVADARAAVATLAAAFYGLSEIQRRGGLRAIGVTGTNGKSTFAYMLRALLSAAGRRAALLGTIEYDLVSRKIASSLTTPDAVTLTEHLVEAHRAGATDAVMEVSSHSLDQRRTDGVTFAAGVFTNLTRDHLDYHGTFDAYLAAKRRLFENLETGAAAVVNADDPAAARIVETTHARVIRYAIESDAEVRARSIRQDRLGAGFVVCHPHGGFEVQTKLVGRHNIANALAAAATGLALGLSDSTIRQGLSGLENVPGRLQRIPTGALPFDVFVDYAHTDDALRNVLSAIRPLTRGRLWCVFGCGGDRDRTKRPLMARAVADGADAFVITSDNPRTEDPHAILREIEAGLDASQRRRGMTKPDRRKAIQYAVDQLVDGDALIIAGKGHEDYQIIGTTRTHFDDTEVAAEAIRRRGGSEK